MRVLNDTVNAVILIAFFVSILMPIVVNRYWPWTATQFTRILMSISYLVALALLAGVIRRLFNVHLDSLWFGWFEAACVAAIPVRDVWMAIAIYRLQVNGGSPIGQPPAGEPPELPEPTVPTEKSDPGAAQYIAED